MNIPAYLRLAMLLASLLACAAAAAADSPDQRIRGQMKALFPDDEVGSIKPTPIAGLYEVTIGASIIYASADGRYVVSGDMIDIATRQNISSQRRGEARSKVFADLDRDETIEFAPSGGATDDVIYVYTDIDCGYCRKLHLEVPQLNAAGITVRYLAFPRSGPNSESFDKATAVWCAGDRQDALTKAKAGDKVSSKRCDNPVGDQFELGRAMGVTGTPAVYTAGGRQLGGYMPAKDLIRVVREEGAAK